MMPASSISASHSVPRTLSCRFLERIETEGLLVSEYYIKVMMKHGIKDTKILIRRQANEEQCISAIVASADMLEELRKEELEKAAKEV